VRRLVVLGVVLVAVVVFGAIVGFVLIDRSGLPSAAKVKSFDAVAVRRSAVEAGRTLDRTITSLDLSPGRVQARSDVDACYADQQQEGFGGGVYNKTCYRRMVVLAAFPITPEATYEKFHIRAEPRWILVANRGGGTCFSQGVAITKDRDPYGVNIDFIVRPAEPSRLDRSFACQLEVGQLAGALTIRSPATLRSLVFNRESTFDDLTQQQANQGDRYPTIVRLGFTLQYYSRRIE